MRSARHKHPSRTCSRPATSQQGCQERRIPVTPARPFWGNLTRGQTNLDTGTKPSPRRASQRHTICDKGSKTNHCGREEQTVPRQAAAIGRAAPSPSPPRRHHVIRGLRVRAEAVKPREDKKKNDKTGESLSIPAEQAVTPLIGH